MYRCTNARRLHGRDAESDTRLRREWLRVISVVRSKFSKNHRTQTLQVYVILKLVQFFLLINLYKIRGRGASGKNKPVKSTNSYGYLFNDFKRKKCA